MKTVLDHPTTPPRLVSFANTCSVEYGRFHHSSGEHNGTPEQFFQPYHWWAHDYLTARDPADWEGVAFIDKREAVETPAGFRLVIAGPMVDPSLDDAEISRCPTPDPLLAESLAMQADSTYATLTAIQVATATPEKAGALDCVSVRAFMRLWKEVGARVGYIRAGQFVEKAP
jgi:hypothetical protein